MLALCACWCPYIAMSLLTGVVHRSVCWGGLTAPCLRQVWWEGLQTSTRCLEADTYVHSASLPPHWLHCAHGSHKANQWVCLFWPQYTQSGSDLHKTLPYTTHRHHYSHHNPIYIFPRVICAIAGQCLSFSVSQCPSLPARQQGYILWQTRGPAGLAQC